MVDSLSFVQIGSQHHSNQKRIACARQFTVPQVIPGHTA